MHQQHSTKARKKDGNESVQAKKRVRLTQEETNDFLTNAKSPFASSPAHVREMFMQCKQDSTLNLDTMDLESLGFQLKPTRNNFCSHFVINGVEGYYECKQCRAQGCDSMCFCESCFEPAKHEGHKYQKIIKQSGWAYCDCGRYERVKKQYFCEKHSAFDQQIQCEIAQADKLKFINSIKAVFECAAYLNRDSTILSHLNSYLSKLNESSVYYNRLTYQLMTAFSSYISQQQKALFKGLHYLYFILSSKVHEKWKFTIHMCGDLKTRKDFIKFICQLVDEGHAQAIKTYFHPYALQQLLNFTAIQKLQQDGFTHKLLHDIFGGNQSSQQIKQAYQRYIKSRLSKCKNLTELFTLSEQIISDRISGLILFRELELFPDEKYLRQYSNKAFLESKKIKNNSISSNIKCVTAQNLPNQVRIASKIIVGLMGAMTEYKRQDLKNLRSYLLSKDIKPERLDEIIHWLILCISYQFRYFQDKKITRMDIIILLLIIKQSPRETEFVEEIWNELLRSHDLYALQKTQRGEQVVPFTQIHILADTFHYICVILLRADFYTFTKLKSKTPSEEQEMSFWFKKFLYQRKAVSLQEIVILKSQGILNFKDASKILNQYCQYNEDQQIFVYNSSKNFKNLANKFPLYPAKVNFPTLYSNQIYFGIEDDIEEHSLSKMLIKLAMNANNLIPLLDAEWQRYQKSLQFKDGKNNYGYLYLFVLVVYDTLTHGKNKEVRERLDILATNADQLIQFAGTQNQLTYLVRLLGYVQKINEKKQQEEKKSEPIMIDKEKAAQKKKKMIEKFNKKRGLVLQKIQSQTNASTDQQICILCHEKEKQDNQFVFISQVNKNNTICSSIHGENNISKTFLITCFHFVHVNCYIDLKKNSYFGFNCPLCQTSSNCILPMTFNREKERLNRVCFNALVATIMASYKVYDVENSFILIFKHLVESKGLNSLLQLSRYEQKKKAWAKNDQFLENLMKEIFQSSDEEEKKSYLNDIDKFVEEIKECKNRQCRIIQLIFAQTFKQIVTSGNSQINKSMLLQIRSLIQEDEFMIIKEQLQLLTIDQIELQPESQEERAKLKASLSFKIIRLPQTASELIKKYYPKNCEACATSQGFHVCLLCDSLLCDNCKIKHSTGLHNENTVYFNLRNFRIDCNRKNYSFSGHIYYNQFKVPLEVGVRFQAMVKDEYTINEIKFQKIMNNFFEN